jgi:alpha-galactosidase
MRENPGTPYPGGRGLFSADMFGVLGDRRSRTGILAGFLSQKQAFGYLEARLDAMAPRLRLAVTCDDLLLEPGEAFTTDWACLQLVSLDDPAPLEPYLEAVALENQARRAAPVPVGWCSWYYYFDHVAQENWQAHLSWAKEHRPEIPFDVIQLDDGFEADVGDWFGTNLRFPEGLAPQVQRIRDAGFRAGLWLAPFLAKSKARLVQEHPDWVLRTPRGHAVNPGFLWNTFPWALDVSLPAVLDHVRRVVHTASHEWGFDYLKLDFLYAAALQGRRHDPRVTRAQALRTALEAMREGAGEQVTLVGCGCPIGSGIGIFDVMRIGADVHSFWHPAYLNVPLSILRPEPDFPSARNSLRNTLTRAPLHRRWWVNDPDCVILRSQETHLTAAEAQTLATLVSLSAGSLLDSDSLPDLSPERREWLARLIPPLPEAVRVIDWFDAAYPSLLTLPLSGAAGRWHLVAVVNWDEGPRTREVDSSVFGLPHANAYHAVDFWAGRYERLAGSTLHFPSIPPHGVRLLALRPATGDAPEWLGDTLHISQGLQVTSWVAQEGRLKCRIDLGRKASGRAWLALPARPVAVSLNGRPLEADWQSTGVCAVPLEFEGEAILEVAWS